jgi:hypothetical protein
LKWADYFAYGTLSLLVADADANPDKQNIPLLGGEAVRSTAALFPDTITCYFPREAAIYPSRGGGGRPKQKSG